MFWFIFCHYSLSDFWQVTLAPKTLVSLLLQYQPISNIQWFLVAESLNRNKWWSLNEFSGFKWLSYWLILVVSFMCLAFFVLVYFVLHSITSSDYLTVFLILHRCLLTQWILIQRRYKVLIEVTKMSIQIYKKHRALLEIEN